MTNSPLPTAHSRFRAGFTLIELLTVIAIIGILAAILIPTVGKVRESARTSECAARMRQWGAAINLYALEAKSTYYISQGKSGDGIGSGVAWSQVGRDVNGAEAAVYAKYFSRVAVGDSKNYGDFLLCPTEDLAKTIQANGGNTPDYTCYVMIWPTLGGTTVINSVPDPAHVPMSRATAASRTMLMVERQFTDNPPAGAPLTSGNCFNVGDGTSKMRSAYLNFRRHGGWVNVVFLDGHVSRMKWDAGTNTDNQSFALSPNGRATSVNPTWFRLDQ